MRSVFKGKLQDDPSTDQSPSDPLRGDAARRILKPINLSQRELAEALHVPYQRINEIVNGRRGMSVSTALRLARFFGTSAAFWLNLQLRWDLYDAQHLEGRELEAIQPYSLTLDPTG